MFDTFILSESDTAGTPFIQHAMEMIILQFCKLPGLWHLDYGKQWSTVTDF